MNKLILGFALFIASVSAANAADIAARPYSKAPPYVAPIASWTGFYVGANGGYGWQNNSASVSPGDPNTSATSLGQVNVPPVAASFDTNGALGGIQAGYNWQFDPKWLVGIEADFDWSDIKGNGSAPTTIAFGATPATFFASQKLDWFGTVHARLGYLPTNNLLLYGTGGLAYGKVNGSASIVTAPGQSNSAGNFGFEYACGPFYGPSTCFAGSQSRTSVGWAAGAGIEYEFANRATFKVEYLYMDLGHQTFASPAVLFTNNPSVMNARSDATFNLVRAGINYRF
jgi:outer membrane immunogenic protein